MEEKNGHIFLVDLMDNITLHSYFREQFSAVGTGYRYTYEFIIVVVVRVP